jgi:hypothetical protein
MAFDCFALFRERYTPFTLASRGDPDVAKICFQRFGGLVLLGRIDLCLNARAASHRGQLGIRGSH